MKVDIMNDAISDTVVIDRDTAHVMALAHSDAFAWHMATEHKYGSLCSFTPNSLPTGVLWEWQNATYPSAETVWDEAHSENTWRVSGVLTEIPVQAAEVIDPLVEDAIRAGANDSQVSRVREYVQRMRDLETANATQQARINDQLAQLARLTNEEIQADDVRLYPVFARAAQEAIAQNYCEVYDRISASVGIPTRDELRATGYLSSDYQVSVDVAYTFTVYVNVSATDEDNAMEIVSNMTDAELADHASGTRGEVLRYEDIQRETTEAELA